MVQNVTFKQILNHRGVEDPRSIFHTHITKIVRAVLQKVVHNVWAFMAKIEVYVKSFSKFCHVNARIYRPKILVWCELDQNNFSKLVY